MWSGGTKPLHKMRITRCKAYITIYHLVRYRVFTLDEGCPQNKEREVARSCGPRGTEDEPAVGGNKTDASRII